MRTLVITMLDLRREPNQRTQHVARMLSELSEETVIVSKTKVMDRSLRAVVRDALTWRIHSSREGSVTTLALHPLLNYAQALAAGLVQGEIVRRPTFARRALASLLSLAGIARDLLLVPSFVLAVLLKTRGTFDLCLVEGPWAGTAGVVLRGFGRVRRIAYDDIDHVAGGQMLALRRNYTAMLERLAMRRADLVVSAGWLLGEHRRRTLGREVLVIPNAVDPSRFAAAHDKPPHPPTLVYVGHLAHYCGVDLAIRALPLIAARVPTVRLVVVGGGDAPYMAGLCELAVSLGVAGQVDIRGAVPYAQVASVLAESDIGLSTFRTTPLGVFAFPLKVIEYMAAGLPVLCTRATEAEEILRRHPAGRAVEFTPQGLAEGALELLTDGEAYGRARAVALQAAQVFTWENMLSQERAAILTMLEQGGVPLPGVVQA
jgi:glycosyltransferase involved in cell wall biosynthesis